VAVRPSPGGFYAGLGTITLVTLTVEVLNARLLSVISWYHLSFFAISMAMLGMTAGAIYVYLRPREFTQERAADRLAHYSTLFAASVPICHLAVLYIPQAHDPSLTGGGLVYGLRLSVACAVPFFLSGVVVAVSLTRVQLPIGRIYFFDLLGAATGCLAAILLLQTIDPTSGSFLLGALAGAGALAYHHYSLGRLTSTQVRVCAALSLAMLLGGAWNGAIYPDGLRLTHAKGRPLPTVDVDRWNTHSRVLGEPVTLRAQPFYWGPGQHVPSTPVREGFLWIDGEAGTPVAEFHGDTSELSWTQHDVTSLAYQLRGGGDVAVIGVGGGRDLLTALAFGATHVTGIEINQIPLDLLRDEYSDFTEIATRPDVTLVHADGRGYLARTDEQFDLIQMSLVDTWASTSAGAMTLTENGLYTVEAFETFLERLKPNGVFTVSRWCSVGTIGENTRLTSRASGHSSHAAHAGRLTTS